MIVSLIVAVAENGVIGKNNDLIWNLPNDMKYFKETTQGHYVIMGRKNFESIPEKFRPLPNRTNVVVSRQKNYKAEGCLLVHSLEEAISLAEKDGDQEPFIIGGGEIYKLALSADLVDRIYLTKVHQSFKGDTFFSKLSDKWKEISRIYYDADDRHDYAYSFLVYEKHNEVLE